MMFIIEVIMAYLELIMGYIIEVIVPYLELITGYIIEVIVYTPLSVQGKPQSIQLYTS